MAAVPPFKILDFELSAEESSDADVLFDRVISQVRPEWSSDRVAVKKLTGGLVNCLTCCHLNDDEKMRDGIVVRTFYSDPEEKATFDRSTEFMSVQLAIHAGVSPPILATFRNGIVYNYAPGRTLEGSDLHNPRIIRAVARALAQFHSVDLDTPLWDLRGNPATYPRENAYFVRFGPMFKRLPEQLKDKDANIWYQEMKSPSYCKAELAAVRKLADELNLPEGLTHMDLHCKNIIYDEENDQAHIIDFEFACIGPCAFDFGGCYNDKWMRDLIGLKGMRMLDEDEDIGLEVHFPTSLILSRHEFCDKDEPEMTQDIVDVWHSEYVKRTYELRGQDPNHLTKHDLEKLRLEAEIAQLWALLHWNMLGRLLADSMLTDELPILEIMKEGDELYEEEKALLPERKDRYLRLLASTPE